MSDFLLHHLTHCYRRRCTRVTVFNICLDLAEAEQGLQKDDADLSYLRVLCIDLNVSLIMALRNCGRRTFSPSLKHGRLMPQCIRFAEPFHIFVIFFTNTTVTEL
ncbi:hypothetical protein Mapa_007321 [Marchantia paleacea]|nr:hypothetical protein Mapa_007321 [Marchantia paleacea]